MDVVSYNCQNLKSNMNMIKKLIMNNDVCFFIEHWLGEEEAYYFNELTDDHQILFEADYSCEARLRCTGTKGRSFGGRCWVVRKCLRVIEYVKLSNALSKITIEDLKGSRVSIFGVWQPFDDGTVVRYCNLNSNLSMLEAELAHMDGICTLVIGDFNADFSRGKRFDRELASFMKKHAFEKLEMKSQADVHTYSNNSRIATIDHMFANEAALKNVTNYSVIIDTLDLSDHRPITCTIELAVSGFDTLQGNCKKLHRFKWKNPDFLETYADLLEGMLKDLLTRFNAMENDIPERLDFLHEGVSKCMLKSARSAEKKCGLVTSNGVRRSKCKFSTNTPEISELTRKLKSLGDAEKMEKLILRKQLRRAQRRRVFQVDHTKSDVIGKLLNEDRNEFWKEVTRAKRCGARRATVVSSKPSASDFVAFYRTLFSHHDRPSNKEHQNITAEVKVHAESLKKCVYTNGFSLNAINEAVGELKSGKAAGASGISNEFFIYGNSTTLIDVLHSMFNLMIETGVIPTGITPVIIQLYLFRFRNPKRLLHQLTIGPSQCRVHSAPYLNFF